MLSPGIPRTRRTHRGFALAAACAAAMAGVLAGATAASASTTPAIAHHVGDRSVSYTFVLPKGTARESLSMGPAKAEVVKSAQLAITCTLNVLAPTKAFDNPRVVVGAAVLSCSSSVAFLNLTVKLTRLGPGGQTSSSSTSNIFSSSISTSTTLNCVNALYGNEVAGQITFPPGYLPPTGAVSGQKTVYIGCPSTG